MDSVLMLIPGLLIVGVIGLVSVGEVPTSEFFNIEKSPPTENDIAKERHATNKMKRNTRIKLALSTASILFFAGVNLIPAYRDIAALHTTTALIMGILLALLYGPFFFVFFAFIDNREKAQHQSLLDPIEKQDCPEMLVLCRKHEKIRLYQNAVAATGRQLTQGEFHVAIEAAALIDKQKAKKAKESQTTNDQQRACTALSHQVQAGPPAKDQVLA